MLRKVLLAIGLLAMLAPVGCMTTDPVIWSWPHHKRRINKFLSDLHEFHVDIDRIVFDMEEYPKELDH